MTDNSFPFPFPFTLSTGIDPARRRALRRIDGSNSGGGGGGGGGRQVFRGRAVCWVLFGVVGCCDTLVCAAARLTTHRKSSFSSAIESFRDAAVASMRRRFLPGGGIRSTTGTGATLIGSWPIGFEELHDSYHSDTWAERVLDFCPSKCINEYACNSTDDGSQRNSASIAVALDSLINDESVNSTMRCVRLVSDCGLLSTGLPNLSPRLFFPRLTLDE